MSFGFSLHGQLLLNHASLSAPAVAWNCGQTLRALVRCQMHYEHSHRYAFVVGMYMSWTAERSGTSSSSSCVTVAQSLGLRLTRPSTGTDLALSAQVPRVFRSRKCRCIVLQAAQQTNYPRPSGVTDQPAACRATTTLISRFGLKVTRLLHGQPKFKHEMVQGYTVFGQSLV
jgi:hypothetical protein